jgi:predicted ATP-grasp superfamily ATP-dependent carboligase
LHVPPIIIDAQELVAGKRLDYEFRNGKLTIRYEGQSLNSVTGVWFRKPRPFDELEVPVDDNYRKYCISAITNFAKVLHSAFPDSNWVSDYYAITRASSKPLQQVVAAKLGFTIPHTIYTNNEQSAKKFTGHTEACVVKSFAVSFPLHYGFYTRSLSPGEDIAYEGLRVAPAIFQEQIEVDYELRVTVVGETVFAASVHLSEKDPSSPVRDWRAGHRYDGKLKFQAYQLPKDLHDKCVALVKELGLVYGAIDLVRDKQGVYWFLEINPNGQWAFIEHEVGMPIGKAIAQLLQTG